LANVTMSGTAAECWKANHLPVRPKPDMTSSLIHSTSLASQRRRSSSRKPGGGTSTPLPEPPIPSRKIAAVRRRSSRPNSARSRAPHSAAAVLPSGTFSR
jgi:hypothetical protein